MNYLQNATADLDKKISEAQKLLDNPEMASLAADEIKKLEEEKKILVSSFSRPETPDNPDSPDSVYDQRNIFLEIRGATGGDEAKLWGEDLLKMYAKYAQTQNWKVSPEGPLIIKISGKNVYSRLKYESGVHRVQRVPVTESSGRVHTSTATVAVLPELEDFDIEIKPEDIEEQFYRSGGHGGQNVNKVSSAVRLTHRPSGTVVTCQDERDQGKNRAKALTKLRQILWEKEQDRQAAELSADRRRQIGTGMRNEKIRTYNFLQDRITDHRLNQNFHHIDKIMAGNLEEIISSLNCHL